MAFNPTYAMVDNEGCDLHYWYQGSGPLIIFIPGGNGIGRQYNIIEALSNRYTCATFDRRQYLRAESKSTSDSTFRNRAAIRWRS
jgi:hypothetical protein